MKFFRPGNGKKVEDEVEQNVRASHRSWVGFTCLLGFSDFLHDFAKNFHKWVARGRVLRRTWLKAGKAFGLMAIPCKLGIIPVLAHSLAANDQL